MVTSRLLLCDNKEAGNNMDIHKSMTPNTILFTKQREKRSQTELAESTQHRGGEQQEHAQKA